MCEIFRKFTKSTIYYLIHIAYKIRDSYYYKNTIISVNQNTSNKIIL